MAKYSGPQDVLDRVQNTLQFDERPIRSVDDRGMFGDTPLILVMTWDDIDAARLLLEAGAALDVQGEDGGTALHRAVGANGVELVRLLLDAGASPNLRDKHGNTPIDLATLLGNAEIVRLLATRPTG